jgi:hypothetical protein
MRNVPILLLLFLTSKCTGQSLVDRNDAIQIAKENGIPEPIDSLTATLKGDTVWEIKSIYCEDYYHSKDITFVIDAKTGKKLDRDIIGFSLNGHSHSKPQSELINNFVDSLIPVNINNPRVLLPDFFEEESQPVISPDNKWIAFSCGIRAIAIASLDGKVYKKICDSCLFPGWTNKINTLVYEKNFNQLYEHNFVSNEIKILSHSNSRYRQFSCNSDLKWIAFIQLAPPKSNNTNELVLSMEGEDNELFILNLNNGKEKRITNLGNVNSPIWDLSGDTIFFYSNGTAYYATDLTLDKPTHAVAKQIGKTSIWDYANSVNNRFIYKLDCKLVLVDLVTLKPLKYVINKPDRYEDISISKDGRYTIFTLKKNKQDKIYIIEN